MDQPDKDTLWYQSNLDVFLNRGYSSYADARKAREHHGGFLNPTSPTFFFVRRMSFVRWVWSLTILIGKRSVGMLRNLRTWRCVSVCVRSERALCAADTAWLFPQPVHQLFSAFQISISLSPMNCHRVRNGCQEGWIRWGASFCRSKRWNVDDPRLIDLFPPEGAVAIRIEGVRDFCFQPALRHTRKHWLNFISDWLQIICELRKWHPREFAFSLKVSQWTVNDDLAVQPLQRADRLRRQNSFIAGFVVGNEDRRSIQARDWLAERDCAAKEKNYEGKRWSVHLKLLR